MSHPHKISIEELCLNVTSGGTPSRSVPQYWEDGTIDWFKTGELKDWYIDSSEEKITEEALAKSSAKIFPENTVLMAMYGDGKTITSLGILKSPAATNQACCAMITDPSKCNFLYLFYALKYHRHELLALVVAGAQRNLSNGIIKRFEINNHSLDVQDRIANILSSYDSLIENNRRRAKILEDSARLLYREWFIYHRYPGHEHVKSSAGVPDGWTQSTVGSLSDYLNRGIAPTYDDEAEYIVINQKCIRNRVLNQDLARRQSKEFPSDKGIRIGDVLINSTGTGTLGRVAQVWESLPNTTVDTHVTIVRPKSGIPYLWLGYLLMSLESLLEGMGEGATNQKELKRTRIGEIPVLLPPERLIEDFHQIVLPITNQITNLASYNRKLIEARDLLLPRLMNGDITV